MRKAPLPTAKAASNGGQKAALERVYCADVGSVFTSMAGILAR